MFSMRRKLIENGPEASSHNQQAGDILVKNTNKALIELFKQNRINTFLRRQWHKNDGDDPVDKLFNVALTALSAYMSMDKVIIFLAIITSLAGVISSIGVMVSTMTILILASSGAIVFFLRFRLRDWKKWLERENEFMGALSDVAALTNPMTTNANSISGLSGQQLQLTSRCHLEDACAELIKRQRDTEAIPDSVNMKKEREYREEFNRRYDLYRKFGLAGSYSEYFPIDETVL